MDDPFKIDGPALVSFSGGRTSAYMLYRILQAHGGKPPPDVVCCFANTGAEMPFTLDFVHNRGEAWNVVGRGRVKLLANRARLTHTGGAPKNTRDHDAIATVSTRVP